MSAVPSFTTRPKHPLVAFSTANTNRDGTGTIGTLYTAPESGALVDEIGYKAYTTTTAGMIRIYIHDGSAYHLREELVVAAATVGAAVAGDKQSINFNPPLPLPSGYSIRLSTHNAESFQGYAHVGEI